MQEYRVDAVDEYSIKTEEKAKRKTSQHFMFCNFSFFFCDFCQFLALGDVKLALTFCNYNNMQVMDFEKRLFEEEEFLQLPYEWATSPVQDDTNQAH